MKKYTIAMTLLFTGLAGATAHAGKDDTHQDDAYFRGLRLSDLTPCLEFAPQAQGPLTLEQAKAKIAKQLKPRVLINLRIHRLAAAQQAFNDEMAGRERELMATQEQKTDADGASKAFEELNRLKDAGAEMFAARKKRWASNGPLYSAKYLVALPVESFAIGAQFKLMVAKRFMEIGGTSYHLFPLRPITEEWDLQSLNLYSLNKYSRNDFRNAFHVYHSMGFQPRVGNEVWMNSPVNIPTRSKKAPLLLSTDRGDRVVFIGSLGQVIWDNQTTNDKYFHISLAQEIDW